MSNNHQQFNEGMEQGDLKRLVHAEMHIDEYKSKLGRDKDVVVLSFKVGGKEPAQDLVSFCEKGYPWIIDADTSSGEMEDGDYLVFVELERTKDLPAQIIELLDDMVNLTEQRMSEWRIRYRSETTDNPATEEAISGLVPLTPEAYEQRYGKADIDKLKAAAGVKVTTKAPKNEYTEALRNLAGIVR